MGKEDYSSSTVVQLKDELKSRGLPVSGKKSELLARLNKNPKSIEKPSSKQIIVDSSDLNGSPFFQSLFSGGLSAVEIDRWKAAKYSMSVFMILAIIISLNSNTWYTLSHSDTSEAEYWGTITTETIDYDLDYGLNDIEFSIHVSGDIQFSKTEIIEYSDCNDQEEVQCEKMSNAGSIMQISLVLSLIFISTFLAIAIARGFGKLESGFIDENYSKIDFWILKLSSSCLLVALIIFALIGFTFDSKYIFEGDASHGLGSTWWLMFVLCSIFVAIVFNTKTMQIIEFVKSQIKQFKSTD
tara:strand:- start:489 stop:1382 length:894 start_codon:yes stop_codon:yes gene_type:complete